MSVKKSGVHHCLCKIVPCLKKAKEQKEKGRKECATGKKGVC